MEAAVEATKRVLDEEAHAHALIGGLAVSARATPRFTDDVDFALWCSDDDAEALIRSFVRRGFTIDALLMTKSTKRIATVRLKPPGSEVLVDLIAMKVLAFRQKDLVDLESLFEAAGSADLALARKAVDAISRAGKEPKRDLSADLERLLAERELPDDAFIKVPRSELAKRFGRKPAPRRKR